VRRVVLVSGAPGAGKSTLAAPLARALDLPLLGKDTIKERLADSLPDPNGDPMAWSRALGGAAMELIWTLAAKAPAVMLEANFRPHSAYEREKLLGLNAAIVEVYCRVPPQEAARRYGARSDGPDRHATHTLRHLSPELLAEFDRPVGLGALIEVDTTQPVDVQAVAQAVRQAFETHDGNPPTR
jgi:predicted kinase